VKKIHKENLIKNYQQLFETYDSLFLVKNCGLTVQNSKDIRGDLKEIGVKFTVIKNSLAKIAIKDSKFDKIRNHFTGPIALACAEEPVATAKILTKLIKDEMPFEIVAASVEGNILESKEVTSLAKLLPQNEVYAKILGLLKAVPNKLVTLLNEPGSQLVRTFKAHAANKQ
jgi:large subunit ribosomal protein L10